MCRVSVNANMFFHHLMYMYMSDERTRQGKNAFMKWDWFGYHYIINPFVQHDDDLGTCRIILADQVIYSNTDSRKMHKRF
jgi:hypothetical protein